MGGRNLFTVASAAKKLGIQKMSVYAFSTENWKRPQEEVDYLMTKPVELFHKNKHRIQEIDYKITFAGRRDRFSEALLEVIDIIEKETANHQGFELTICIDYGAYDELITAINQTLKYPVTKESLESHLICQRTCRFTDSYQWRTKIIQFFTLASILC
jgi:undecaprenyl diphosphate synthase